MSWQVEFVAELRLEGVLWVVGEGGGSYLQQSFGFWGVGTDDQTLSSQNATNRTCAAVCRLRPAAPHAAASTSASAPEAPAPAAAAKSCSVSFA